MTFSAVLERLVERLVESFPYHGFLQLIALENSAPPGAAPSERAQAAAHIMSRCVGAPGRRTAPLCNEPSLCQGQVLMFVPVLRSCMSGFLGRMRRKPELDRVLGALRTLCNAYTALGLQTAERQKSVSDLAVATEPVWFPLLFDRPCLLSVTTHCAVVKASLSCNRFGPSCMQNKTPTFQLTDVKVPEGRAGSKSHGLGGGIPGAPAFDGLLSGRRMRDLWCVPCLPQVSLSAFRFPRGSSFSMPSLSISLTFVGHVRFVLAVRCPPC